MVFLGLFQLLQLFFIARALLTPQYATALEATFTPNPDNSTGQLPLSQKTRDRLTKLEQAIRSSPDPQATLNEVAEANKMKPADLIGMLERNRNDMAGKISASKKMSSWPQAVLQILVTIALVIKQLHRSIPRPLDLAWFMFG